MMLIECKALAIAETLEWVCTKASALYYSTPCSLGARMLMEMKSITRVGATTPEAFCTKELSSNVLQNLGQLPLKHAC
jgi:hypothetical protein